MKLFLLLFLTLGCSLLSGQESVSEESSEAQPQAEEVRPLEQKNSKGVTYYLHRVEVKSKSGKVHTFYFFTKTYPARKGQPVAALPAGYMISETKSGLPILKKKKATSEKP